MLADHRSVIDRIEKCIRHINVGDCSNEISATQGELFTTNDGKCVLHVNDIHNLGKFISEVVNNINQPPRAPDLFDLAMSTLSSRMRKKYDENISVKEHSWTDMKVSDLYGLLQEEFDELLEALRECNPNKAVEELVDIANFCAMLINRLEKV